MDNHQNEIEKGCTEIEDEAREDVWNGDGTRVAIVRTAKTWMSHSAGLVNWVRTFQRKKKVSGCTITRTCSRGSATGERGAYTHVCCNILLLRYMQKCNLGQINA
jgi:hypothetical protein